MQHAMLWNLLVCLCMFCVCVREREREREGAYTLIAFLTRLNELSSGFTRNTITQQK